MSSERRRAGALNAGIHVRAVVVTDIQKIVATLNRARKIAARCRKCRRPRRSPEILFLHPLAVCRVFERLIHGFNSGNRGRHIFKGIVDIRNVPGRIRINRGRNLKAPGCATAATSGYSAAARTCRKNRASRAARHRR